MIAIEWGGAAIHAELHRGTDLQPGDRVTPEIAPEAGTWVAK